LSPKLNKKIYEKNQFKTQLVQNRPKVHRNRHKVNEIDRIGPKWTEGKRNGLNGPNRLK